MFRITIFKKLSRRTIYKKLSGTTTHKTLSRRLSKISCSDLQFRNSCPEEQFIKNWLEQQSTRSWPEQQFLKSWPGQQFSRSFPEQQSKVKVSGITIYKFAKTSKCVRGRRLLNSQCLLGIAIRIFSQQEYFLAFNRERQSLRVKSIFDIEEWTFDLLLQ